MDHERLAMTVGRRDASDAIRRWNADPWTSLRPWLAVSLVAAVALMVATGIVAALVPPGTEPARVVLFRPGHLADAWHIFTRNLLVLALHSLICLAGYLAAISVPVAAEDYEGWVRRLHLSVRPAALVLLTAATIGSFLLQALAVGRIAPTIARSHDMSVPELLVALTPHAIPELTALFLPLGAWIVLVRADAWRDLAGACVVAPALATPVIAAAALVEVYVTPLLLRAIT